MNIRFKDFYIPKEGVDYLRVGKDLKEYILLKQYILQWYKGDVLFRIVVPANFNTDFGTTPFGIFNEPYMVPGYIVHDWLYYQNTNETNQHWYQFFDPLTQSWQTLVADWKRPESDKMMLYCHTEAGAPWLKRSVVYRSVRIFGKPYWES